MPRRVTMLIGGALGAIWALALVFGVSMLGNPFVPFNVALTIAFLPVGITLMAMIGWAATRRFFDSRNIDGVPPAVGSAAEIDARVLQNTMEQAVLALLIWPFAITVLGAVTVIAMGFAFAVARLAFWIGYRLSPPLRAFGFAATFYPTVLAAFSWVAVVL